LIKKLQNCNSRPLIVDFCTSQLSAASDLDLLGSENICLSGMDPDLQLISDANPKFSSGSKINVEIIICPSIG
jgi:hypothetical protein